jgi:hypothetical protein
MAKAQCQKAHKKAVNIFIISHQALEEFESSFGIQTRWTPADAEWIEALNTLKVRNLWRALDELCRLLVQRLFELEKLGLGATGQPSCLDSGFLLTTFRLSFAEVTSEGAQTTLDSSQCCPQEV